MSATQTVGPGAAAPETARLRLVSPSGTITRTVLRTPLREATPSKIPLIDVSPLLGGSLAERRAVARKMHEAASNTGFFYINHGITAEVPGDACAASLDFFRQDLDTKMKAEAQSPCLGGYHAPKTMRLNPYEGIDVREAFWVNYHPRMDPAKTSADIPRHVAEYAEYEDYAWQQTAKVPQLRGVLTRHFETCLGLARVLTRAFALDLDLAEDAFDSKVEYPGVRLAVNYYPPLTEGASATEPGGEDERVSIGSHTDFQPFTMLWQDDSGGLQVLNREGQWVKARPMCGTFVVNLGDLMQRIANDRYVSTVHRAQNWNGRERVSMPFF